MGLKSSKDDFKKPFAHVKGLEELEGPINDEGDIYVRPASFGVTPIWYRHDKENMQWFWTPYSPFESPRSNHEWMPVSDMQVRSGYWKNEEPAQCNKKIIQILNQLNPSNISRSKSSTKNSRIHPTSHLQKATTSLRCRFCLKEKHPMLLLYAEMPTESYHLVVKIDLTYYEMNEEIKHTRVRVLNKTWGDFGDAEYKFFPTEYVIKKTYDEIRDWCIQYENQHKIYSLYFNNCRRFMMNLCAFLNIPFPDSYPMEAILYTAQAITNSENYTQQKDN